MKQAGDNFAEQCRRWRIGASLTVKVMSDANQQYGCSQVDIAFPEKKEFRSVVDTSHPQFRMIIVTEQLMCRQTCRGSAGRQTSRTDTHTGRQDG